MSSRWKSWTSRQHLTAPSESEPEAADANVDSGSVNKAIKTVDVDSVSEGSELESGTLSLREDAAGGMGRHLGVFSCTLLIVGRIIGTGIFSTPSSILGSVGSVGASLMLWVLGFCLSSCGLLVWLEFGTMLPRSGGEKVYLEAAYKRPRFLATTVYGVNSIILGFASANCIVFASCILAASGAEDTRWRERGIAVAVIGFVTLIHGLTPRFGVYLMNSLTMFKIMVLLFTVITGWVVLSGHTKIQDPHQNFRNAFAGSSHSSSDYATAMFKIIFSFNGWSNVNFVMNNVKDPIRTLKIAGPLGLGICTLLYIFANIAYFSVASKEEIIASGDIVASLFFQKVFGDTAQKALTVFIALSALGYLPATLSTTYRNILSVSFTIPRVIQELAKEGLPLPFGNSFWASNWPTYKAPFPSLLWYFIITTIVIVVPPPGVAYPFILDVQGYPGTIINLFIVLGFFILRWREPNAHRPFKVFLPFAIFYLGVTVFLLVAPFIRPSNGVGDTPPLPYWLYCVVGIGIIAGSITYWALWYEILPRVFRYRLVPEKRVLDDGTHVTVLKREKIN